MKMKYEITLIMNTDSSLEPEQILGEMEDDYKKNYKTEVSLRITNIKR